MTLYMRDMENREAGEKIGIEKGQATIIASMYESGMSLEQIAGIVKMTVEEVKNLLSFKASKE